MHKFIFSKKENKDLWAANEKQKQKRTCSRRQIAHEEGLSVSEACGLIEALIEVLRTKPRQHHVIRSAGSLDHSAQEVHRSTITKSTNSNTSRDHQHISDTPRTYQRYVEHTLDMT